MRREVRASTVTLDYIQTIRTKSGRTYRYLRMPGHQRVRLPDLPLDDPDFLAAYAAARAAAPRRIRATTGTIAAACEAYLASDRYLAHSPAYRALLRRHIDAIREQAEDAMLAHLRPDDIADDLAALKPNVAGHRLKAWRAVCTFATDPAIRLIRIDPSKGVAKPRAPKSDGHRPWDRHDIATFRARWPIGTTPRACFELLFGSKRRGFRRYVTRHSGAAFFRAGRIAARDAARPALLGETRRDLGQAGAPTPRRHAKLHLTATRARHLDLRHRLAPFRTRPS